MASDKGLVVIYLVLMLEEGSVEINSAVNNRMHHISKSHW